MVEEVAGDTRLKWLQGRIPCKTLHTKVFLILIRGLSLNVSLKYNDVKSIKVEFCHKSRRVNIFESFFTSLKGLSLVIYRE
jgi:hypothetical protein